MPFAVFSIAPLPLVKIFYEDFSGYANGGVNLVKIFYEDFSGYANGGVNLVKIFYEDFSGPACRFSHWECNEAVYTLGCFYSLP
jgi:hypothetical protein